MSNLDGYGPDVISFLKRWLNIENLQVEFLICKNVRSLHVKCLTGKIRMVDLKILFNAKYRQETADLNVFTVSFQYQINLKKENDFLFYYLL